VKEEITTVAKEAGFQDVSDNYIVELLKCCSFPLMNEILAALDRQMYKEAQDGHDVQGVISEENTLKDKRFKRNLQQN
jgi:hypothetical protein